MFLQLDHNVIYKGWLQTSLSFTELSHRLWLLSPCFFSVCVCVWNRSFSQLLHHSVFHGYNSANNAERVPAIGIWYLTLTEMLSRSCLASASNNLQISLSLGKFRDIEWIHWLILGKASYSDCKRQHLSKKMCALKQVKILILCIWNVS